MSWPATDCPSCHGTGWATVRVQSVTVAGGTCRCVGGHVWAIPPEPDPKPPGETRPVEWKAPGVIDALAVLAAPLIGLLGLVLVAWRFGWL